LALPKLNSPLAPLPRPRLVLPLGDPAGIGPEVVLKALLDPKTKDLAEFTLVGNRQSLKQLAQHLGVSLPANLAIIDQPLPVEIDWGKPNPATGEVSFLALQTAIQQTLAGQFDGIVTAPIAKSVWMQAGHIYPGQTELLAEMAGVSRYGMLFAAESPHTGWQLRALLATTHIPLQQVPQVLNPELLSNKLGLLVDCLQQDFGVAQPRIAIAGLNPHSGEQGQLGREEQDWLIPWLEQTRPQYPHVELIGPVPPDTLWVTAGQAWFGTGSGQAYDGYLALYHDQGLIPVKLMAFDRAVNTTIGLPFVRTSPDHGTAFDIAGKGIADATSMIAAIQLAAQLVSQRQHHSQLEQIVGDSQTQK
jgi:4-hydroxythreonine-4-phosphate dehydrogenase